MNKCCDWVIVMNICRKPRWLTVALSLQGHEELLWREQGLEVRPSVHQSGVLSAWKGNMETSQLKLRSIFWCLPHLAGCQMLQEGP